MMEQERGLELFGDSKEPNAEIGWQLYQKSLDFKNSINLFDTVKTNENYFVGKQWEGIETSGLPTPTFNIIKRVVTFITATITSDNIKVTATALANAVDNGQLEQIVNTVNDELAFIFERNRIPALLRKFARNAAVDGDGCTYTYWDPTIETGQAVKGGIRTEVISNQRVHFGNPNVSEVQTQPWIIIEMRESARRVKRKAKQNGMSNWAEIMTDDQLYGLDDVKRTDDKVTVLLLLWKDEDTGEVWSYEFTKNCAITEPQPLGIYMYPITWLNWDTVQDCYHGQAMITGLIPNQVFINKAWSLSILSMMHSAFPKYIYNKTLIPRLDNRVGGAYGIAGGDVNNVIKTIEPAAISPQVSQYIELAINETESSLGATSVALGDTRPDNTSAIIALQRAAATPSEMTKQNLYDATEELSRIYFEFMAEYYGVRYVMQTPSQEMRLAMELMGQAVPAKIPVEFDFSILKRHPMMLKLDVGASTYYSEIAAMSTLDNLLRMGLIDPIQYLERVSDDYVPKRLALIEELKQQRQMMMGMPAQAPADSPGAAPAQQAGKPEIPTCGGYSQLQRQINATGSTEGMI